jgi:hypothetical protein
MEVVIDGKRRTSELRTSGEVVTLTAESSVLLTLGDTEAAHVEVDGRPLTVPAGAGRVIRDLRIDRELAARLAAAPAPVP